MALINSLFLISCSESPSINKLLKSNQCKKMTTAKLSQNKNESISTCHLSTKMKKMVLFNLSKAWDNDIK